MAYRYHRVLGVRQSRPRPFIGHQKAHMEAVTVGLGRNDRRPGDKGLSTKSFAYRRDES